MTQPSKRAVLAVVALIGFAVIGFLAHRYGAGYSIIKRTLLNVKDFGARGDGISNDTIAIQKAIDESVKTPGLCVYIPEGTYIVDGLKIYSSSVRIAGAGSGVTILKRRRGSAPSNVVEFGRTSLGNSAPHLENEEIRGMTLDGSRKEVERPSGDLTDWGLALTNTSYSKIEDVVAVSCWNGGVGVFINSNYNVIQCAVRDCGYSDHPGEPGFDINSSNYNIVIFESIDCRDGARVIDNSYGNTIVGNIKNALTTGFIYGNQSVNKCSRNTFILRITSGCAAQGVSVGSHCTDSLLLANIDSVYGAAVREHESDDSGDIPANNTYIVQSAYSGYESCDARGAHGTWVIESRFDGRAGAQGSNYAVRLGGRDNNILCTIYDTSPWHVRSVYDNGSHNNCYVYRNVVANRARASRGQAETLK